VNGVPSGERGHRTSGTDGNGRTANTGSGSGSGVPQYARPRDGGEPVGTAVPRGTTPRPPTGGVGIFVPGAYYGPYGYGYGYFDPWLYGAGVGYGIYGGYYDPWYGGYPMDPQAGTSAPNDEGKLRLKIKPRDAEVYVDGYYVGVVDDFDGIFQRLHLDSGPHRIEVRAPGYESLSLEVRITPDHTTTYEGELKKLQ
jgi:PEGA domain-containing protein